MPNFMLVSLNARFLLKIDLICLAISSIRKNVVDGALLGF